MKNKSQCKYCSRIIINNTYKEDICGSCYIKRNDIRWFREKLEPLRKVSEDRLINSVEYAMDCGLLVNQDKLNRYYRIIEERKNNNDG